MLWKSGGRKLRWNQLTQVHLENGGQMEVGRCNSWELHSWSKAAGSTPSHSTFMQSHNKLFTYIHARLCTSNLLAHCGTRQQCLLHMFIQVFSLFVYGRISKRENVYISQTEHRDAVTYWVERSRELILDNSALNHAHQASWIHYKKNTFWQLWWPALT